MDAGRAEVGWAPAHRGAEVGWAPAHRGAAAEWADADHGPVPADCDPTARDNQLPELAGVRWRPRVDERALRRADRVWTASAVAHQVPFLITAVALAVLDPVMIPASLVALVFAWVIPALYAARGAGVLRPPHHSGRGPDPAAHRRALGLLGDLVDHAARDLLDHYGMALERGRFGVWLLAPAGALLVRSGGRRVQCYCVRVTGDDLPDADRVAHLLLALRADESGFATVANLTFSGSCRRLRRRLPPTARDALAVACATARSHHP